MFSYPLYGNVYSTTVWRIIMEKNNLETCLNFLQEETELDLMKEVYTQQKPNAFTTVLEFYVKTVKINFSLN